MNICVYRMDREGAIQIQDVLGDMLKILKVSKSTDHSE